MNKLKLYMLLGVLLQLGFSCDLFESSSKSKSDKDDDTELPMTPTTEPDWSSEPPGGDTEELMKFFLQTFDIEQVSGVSGRGVRPVLMNPQTSYSRATVDVSGGLSFVNGSKNDYPEVGLTTSWTVATTGVANVYRITSTTTYPGSNDVIDSYIEEYFIKDVTPGDDNTSDGSWTWDDPVTDASGNRNPFHREKMEMHFDDGSVRYEQIVDLADAGTGFAAFDINDSLFYPDFSYPATDTNANYSSVVIYSQDIATSHNYWFWEGTVSGALLGVRFYTEHPEGTGVKGTMVAYERAIETYTTTGGDFASQMDDVFIGSEHTTLAESVFRKEVVFDSRNTAVSADTTMRTHVVDTDGSEGRDFLIQRLENDKVQFADWEAAP